MRFPQPFNTTRQSAACRQRTPILANPDLGEPRSWRTPVLANPGLGEPRSWRTPVLANPGLGQISAVG